MRVSAKRVQQQRRQLDRKRERLLALAKEPRPAGGWVRAIREALGMSSAQLAKRLGVSQAQVVRLEQRERRGGVTLATLERVAAALGCRFNYVLVPAVPLQDMVSERARKAARRLLGRAAHSMALEEQSTDAKSFEDQVEDVARELCDKARSEVWEET